VERAREAIASGAAHSVMEQFVKRTTDLVESSPA
jgi:anthranilate phosphoribosyltransferase